MAHVTAIATDAQVEYRIGHGHGCGPRQPDIDLALDYRLGGMGGAQQWIGRGLPDVGLEAGRAFTDQDAHRAKALMDGEHPFTGERLVEPVLRLPEEAKLPALPLLDHLVGLGLSPVDPSNRTSVADWDRLQRGCHRLGEAYTVDVRLLSVIAQRAGVDISDVYGPARVDAAHTAEAAGRVDVRTRGYDLTLTLPKSFSVAWALAPTGERRAIADAYLQAAVDTVSSAEGWHAKASRGHHGDGIRADVVDTSGFLGWLSVDPVNRNGDAHWHAHVTLAALGKGPDGKWSALASTGQDSLFTSVGALGGLMEARARAICEERFGWQYRESELTGRLEVAHVPDAAIRATSTRRADVVAALLDAGLDPTDVSAKEDADAALVARRPKVEGAEREPAIVARTRAQVVAEGVDDTLPRAVVSSVDLRPAEAERRRRDGLELGSWSAQVADVQALLVDREAGPTAHAQSFTERQAIGIIAANIAGVGTQEQAELLVAAALDTPEVVRLDAKPNRLARYTTREIVEAERTILESTRRAPSDSAPVVTEEHLEKALRAFTQRAGYRPTDEQQTAVRHITQGGENFDVISGLPGTGKTTIMRLVNDAYAQAGIGVRGVAVAALAAEGLSHEAGFPSTTVRSAVLTGRRDASSPGHVGVLVVDEAGMVDTRDMATLLRMARRDGVKVIAIGDDRQLPSVGVGGWFATAHDMTEGITLTDVRRQSAEHELAALRAFRAGQEMESLRGFAAAGQVVVTNTRDEALAAAAAVWSERTAGVIDPQERVEQVALLAGRREDTQILNALARAKAREAGYLEGRDAHYRLAHGGELHLAIGDTVILRRNDGSGPAALRNGRRAVVEGIDEDRLLTLGWTDALGQRQRVQMTPGEVIAGQVSASYIEADFVQSAAATTVHLAQGRTVEHTVAVIDPESHAQTYVALSRDRKTTTLVLSAEAVAGSPEELQRLQQLPTSERDATVVAAYATKLHAAGLTEAEKRRMVLQQWPEFSHKSNAHARERETEPPARSASTALLARLKARTEASLDRRVASFNTGAFTAATSSVPSTRPLLLRRPDERGEGIER